MLAKQLLLKTGERTTLKIHNFQFNFSLDLKYTQGDFYYVLNPLYIDYYDMYFIPDDQCVLNQFGYENDT